MKEIQVDSYTRSDGTKVKAHTRGGVTGSASDMQNQVDDEGNPIMEDVQIPMPQNEMDLVNQILQGGVEYNQANPGLSPIAQEIQNQVMNEQSNALMDGLRQMQNNAKLQLDSTLDKVVNAPNQEEYAKALQEYVQQKESFEKAQNLIESVDYQIKNAQGNQMSQPLGNEQVPQINFLQDLPYANDLNRAALQSQLNPMQQSLNNAMPTGFNTPFVFDNSNPMSFNHTLLDTLNMGIDRLPPQVNKGVLDMGLNAVNNITKHLPSDSKLNINDGTQYWNLSSSDFTNGVDYLANNGKRINNLHKIEDNELKFTVAQKLKQQNLPIDSTQGIVFNEGSDVAKAITNNSVFKGFVNEHKSELQQGKSVSGSVQFPLKQDLNLGGAIGHGDIVGMKIEPNGDLTTKFLDTYDFNQNERNPLVRMGRSVQEAGLLNNYFNITEIRIPKQQLEHYWK